MLTSVSKGILQAAITGQTLYLQRQIRFYYDDQDKRLASCSCHKQRMNVLKVSKQCCLRPGMQILPTAVNQSKAQVLTVDLQASFKAGECAPQQNVYHD